MDTHQINQLAMRVKQAKATLEEVELLAMIPEEKRIVLVMDNRKEAKQ